MEEARVVKLEVQMEMLVQALADSQKVLVKIDDRIRKLEWIVAAGLAGSAAVQILIK